MTASWQILSDMPLELLQQQNAKRVILLDSTSNPLRDKLEDLKIDFQTYSPKMFNPFPSSDHLTLGQMITRLQWIVDRPLSAEAQGILHALLAVDQHFHQQGRLAAFWESVQTRIEADAPQYAAEEKAFIDQKASEFQAEYDQFRERLDSLLRSSYQLYLQEIDPSSLQIFRAVALGSYGTRYSTEDMERGKFYDLTLDCGQKLIYQLIDRGFESIPKQDSLVPLYLDILDGVIRLNESGERLIAWKNPHMNALYLARNAPVWDQLHCDEAAYWRNLHIWLGIVDLSYPDELSDYPPLYNCAVNSYLREALAQDVPGATLIPVTHLIYLPISHYRTLLSELKTFITLLVEQQEKIWLNPLVPPMTEVTSLQGALHIVGATPYEIRAAVYQFSVPDAFLVVCAPTPDALPPEEDLVGGGVWILPTN